MFAKRWCLFRLRGIPIRLDASWLIILTLLTWTLMTLFPGALPNFSFLGCAVMSLVCALAFFVCVVLHELGHALVARSVGIPIHGITLFLFGGVAEMEDDPPSASSEFWMVIAGPAVNAVLAVGFWLSAKLVHEPILVVPLHYLAGINLVELVFNLLPAFPLDGGRILRSLLWGVLHDRCRATFWAGILGQAFAWLLIGLGLLLLLTGAVFQGVCLGLVGLFLSNAAEKCYSDVLVRQAALALTLHRNSAVHVAAEPRRMAHPTGQPRQRDQAPLWTFPQAAARNLP